MIRFDGSVYIIAECGSCHDGDLDQAMRMIEVAKTAGADCAKFQWWSSAERLASRRNASDYLETYRRYQVPFEWLPQLQQECARQAIDFMCTTYLPEDVWRIVPFVDTMKIASFEAGDLYHLSAHIGPRLYGKDVVVSLGLGGNPRWIQSIVGVDVPTEEGWSSISRRGRLYFMHCTSAYPAPVIDLHLRRIRYVDPTLYGFSDHAHASSTLSGAVAVGAGAIILERHIRLVSTDEHNPDAPHAMLPQVFAEYVGNVRWAEAAMGRSNAALNVADTPQSEELMRPFRVGRGTL